MCYSPLLTVAPFTLPFQCGNHAPILHIAYPWESLRCREGVQFCWAPALFSQRLVIIGVAKACHFSAFVCSHCTKQLWHTAAPVCQSIQAWWRCRSKRSLTQIHAGVFGFLTTNLSGQNHPPIANFSKKEKEGVRWTTSDWHTHDLCL